MIADSGCDDSLCAYIYVLVSEALAVRVNEAYGDICSGSLE